VLRFIVGGTAHDALTCTYAPMPCVCIAELLTQCYDGTTPSGLGPINPTSNFTFPFLTSFFNEIAQVFPDDYIHVGGDEVPYNCW
jgi:hypothetical protein